MDLQLSHENRIRLLLHNGVMRAELLALSSWMVTQYLVHTGLQIDSSLWSFLPVMIAFGIQTFTRSDVIWRVAGFIFVVTYAISFKMLFLESAYLYKTFSLPFAVIAVVGASLLTRSTFDYVLTAFTTWLIVWPYVEPASTGDINHFIVIFALYSVALGWVNNNSYMRSLRSALTVESRYRTMAETDFLTAIFNRRALMERFERFVATGPGGFFLMVDIDNFKKVNDEFGHDVGDEVLRAMARCLMTVEGSYCFGRLGGEEFGVVINTLDEHIAVAYCEQLMTTVRECTVTPCPFTISAGLTAFLRGHDVSEILKQADRNLYAAKHAGKNNFKYCPRPKVIRSIRTT